MLKQSPIAGLCMALVSFGAAGCLGPTDMADGYNTTATVKYSDGAAIPGFVASAYEVIFGMNDGSNIARTYTTGSTPTPPSGNGILTAGDGTFNLSIPDVSLTETRYDTTCYDTCVSWSTQCDYDYYGNYYCHDVCSWYTTDCYDTPYTASVEFASVANVTTYLDYTQGTSTVRTLGVASAQSTDSSTNLMTRTETFTTPLANPASSASPALGDHSPKGFSPAKYTACDAQGELNDAQFAAVQALRTHLAITPEQIRCRK
ncbi:MAG TPA: hypothetical protein VL588_10470 [Bdellovibrionota bacterium]|nr:hypothetical protein [Bdellovibrionota bacterium]